MTEPASRRAWAKREGCARTLGASFFFSAKIILQLQHVAIAPTIPSFATIPFLMALVQKQGVEFAIQPQATAPAIDTSEWPLLLKDYDKRESPTGGNASRCMLIPKSSRSNRPFHPNPRRLQPAVARPQILHLLWRHQPRQTFKPILT